MQDPRMPTHEAESSLAYQVMILAGTGQDGTSLHGGGGDLCGYMQRLV
jgi:hypothetical protein